MSVNSELVVISTAAANRGAYKQIKANKRAPRPLSQYRDGGAARYAHRLVSKGITAFSRKS